MKIYKFQLRSGIDRDVEPFDDIMMPGPANVLSVVMQDNHAYVYALCDSGTRIVKKRIWIVGTGKELPKAVAHNSPIIARFVATISDEINGFIWHVFEGMTTFVKGPNDV